MIFILSGHTHDDNDDDDDEPLITEEVFFSCVRGQRVPFCFTIDCLKELKKNEVLDESSFEIVASLDSPREAIDRLHYVMYRIGRKENGLQIFYQCLKETQDRASGHRHSISIMEHQG